MENFLVCHPKIMPVYAKKVAPEKHRFAANKEAQLDPGDKATDQK